MTADAIPTPSAEDRAQPLLRLIDTIRASEEQIRARVEARRAEIASRTGLTGLELRQALVDELIGNAKWRAAGVGAVAALPVTLPLLGFWGSLVFTVVGAALLQLAMEVELVIALSFAYEADLPPERLRMIAFWLVRLTNYDDLRSRALTLGVRLTVRKLVEKLLAVGLARAFEATAHEVMMARMMGRAPGESWPVRATRYLGVPLLFYFGWQSAAGVGERARAWFEGEVAQ